MDDYKSLISKLKKLEKTPTVEGEEFLRKCKPEHIEFLAHLLHTFKEYTPAELKRHVRRVLSSTSCRMGKSRMIKAHQETGGAFFDWLKNGAADVSNLVKDKGTSIMSTAKGVFDKAVPYFSKGLENVKLLLGKAASKIPVVSKLQSLLPEATLQKGISTMLTRLT
jgi:hypothetical protein